MNGNQRKNKKVNRKGKGNIPVSGQREVTFYSTSIPRGLAPIMPDRIMRKLTYNGFKNLKIATGQFHKSYRWLPTAVYDIDPLLGSTTVVGFTELAGFYYFYRVVSSRATIAVAANYQSQGTGALTPTCCNFVVVPLNADPGTTPSDTTIFSWYNNPYNKHKLIGAPGARPEKVVSSMATEKIFGSKMVYTDDNFAALVSTVPVNNWYWAVAVSAADASGSTNYSFSVQTDFEMMVEFYSRKPLVN